MGEKFLFYALFYSSRQRLKGKREEKLSPPLAERFDAGQCTHLRIDLRYLYSCETSLLDFEEITRKTRSIRMQITRASIWIYVFDWQLFFFFFFKWTRSLREQKMRKSLLGKRVDPFLSYDRGKATTMWSAPSGKSVTHVCVCVR